MLLHCTLGAALVYLLLFYVALSEGRFKDLLGSPPKPFVAVVGVSDFLKDNVLFLSPLLPVVVWADARLCAWLGVRYGEAAVWRWGVAVAVLLSATLILCLWGLGSIDRGAAEIVPWIR